MEGAFDSSGEMDAVSKKLGAGLVGVGPGLVPGGDCLAPSNKIYQQGLVLFLWLPTLVLAWSARAVLVQAWKRQPALWMSVLLLLAGVA